MRNSLLGYEIILENHTDPYSFTIYQNAPFFLFFVAYTKKILPFVLEEAAEKCCILKLVLVAIL